MSRTSGRDQKVAFGESRSERLRGFYYLSLEHPC